MTAQLHTCDMLFRVDMDMALLSRTAAELLDKMGHRVHALRMFSGQAAVLHTDMAELTLTVQHTDTPRTRLSVQPGASNSAFAELEQLTKMLTRQLCEALGGQEIDQYTQNAATAPPVAAGSSLYAATTPPSERRRSFFSNARRGRPLAPRDVWQSLAISGLAMMMAIASLSYYAGPYGF